MENKTEMAENSTKTFPIAPETDHSDPLPTIKMYQDIVDRAHAEVKGVREVYKWLSVALGIICSTGIGIAAYLTYSHIHEMKSDMRLERDDIRKQMQNQIDLMNAKAKQDYVSLATDLTSSVQKNVHDVEGKVNSRIDAEFNKDNIQNLVKNSAQEHIDRVADKLIAHQIDRKIAPKIEIVDKKLLGLEKDAAFIMTSNAAQGGDRASYQLLLLWSKDKTYPKRDRAQEIVDEIISRANTDYLTASGRVYPWKPGVDPAKLSFEELKEEYNSASSAPNRSDLLSYIHSRENISKTRKLEFFVEVICNDPNLDVASSAGTFFIYGSGHNFNNRLDCKAYKEWYEKHHSELK